MVLEADSQGMGNDLLRKIHNTINENINTLRPTNDKYSKIKVFTDNIVIGNVIRDDGESELGTIFLDFASYQLALALEGFFVRGGISIGPHYMDEYLVYGPALIEAHAIEEKLACVPRIVLSDEAVKLVNKHIGYYANPLHAPQSRDLLKDIDGQWFVNYLEASIIGRDSYGFQMATQVLKQHKVVVEDKLKVYSNNQKVLDKYIWVANYHNWFVDENLGGDKKLKINFHSNIGVPTLIV